MPKDKERWLGSRIQHLVLTPGCSTQVPLLTGRYFRCVENGQSHSALFIYQQLITPHTSLYFLSLSLSIVLQSASFTLCQTKYGFVKGDFCRQKCIKTVNKVETKPHEGLEVQQIKLCIFDTVSNFLLWWLLILAPRLLFSCIAANLLITIKLLTIQEKMRISW